MKVFIQLLPLVLCCLWPNLGNSQTPEPLTLPEAVARVLKDHPSTRAFDWQRQAAQGARQQAALRPQLELALELENFAGSGETQGLDAVETTLSLSSVIELGGKRTARTALADAQLDQTELEIETQTLDLIGTTTEYFVTALAAQAHLALTQETVVLEQSTLAALQQRARAGAVSDTHVLRAQAALARARLALEQQSAELQIARTRLASLWGEPKQPPHALKGDLFALPRADDFQQLLVRAQNNPQLKRLTQEEQLHRLQAQIARAETRADLRWSLGLRHLAESDSNALVAGISLPLNTAGRSRAERTRAEARAAETQQHKRQAGLELHSRLFEIYTRREQALRSALLLRDQLLPALTQAYELSRRAFEGGGYTYLDLTTAQHELLEARRESIDAAATALLLGALLEQLTGTALTAQTSPRQRP
jgi:cobalt-zinc-cadmium efflux system outer membrane protein